MATIGLAYFMEGFGDLMWGSDVKKLNVGIPIDDVKESWGKNVAKLHSNPEKLIEALRDYTWGISGPTDVSRIVKAHLASEGYGFVIEEDDWGDEDW